jgi:hypothetical protein
MLTLLRCLGEAVVAQGMRGLMGLVPFGEQIYDVAADAIGRYREACREQQLAADLQALVQADSQQVRQEAQQIAREVAAGRSEEEIKQVEAYLNQIPGVARQSLRRPQDPTGTTVPATLQLDDPIQFATVLPRRAPRFRIGEAMPHAPQWRFVELLGSGGFGEVWLVKHTFLDQCRAVKFCLDPAGLPRRELGRSRGALHGGAPKLGRAGRSPQLGWLPLARSSVGLNRREARCHRRRRGTCSPERTTNAEASGATSVRGGRSRTGCPQQVLVAALLAFPW